MPGCCVLKCKNSTVKGYSLFRVPKGERRKEWLELIGRIELPERADICEVHFGKEQFENNRKDGKKKLRPFARPNLLESIKDPTINPLEQCIISTEEFTTDPVESTTNLTEECINLVEKSTTFVIEKCKTHVTGECTINPTESYEYQRNAQVCATKDICSNNDDNNKFKTSIIRKRTEAITSRMFKDTASSCITCV